MNQPLFVEMNLQVMAVLGNGVPRIGLGLGLGGPVAKVEKIGVGVVGGWFVVKKKLISRKLSFFRVRASFSGSSTSRLGLNPETFQPQESSKMLWIGPVPGDISEVEAYCRIFRAAEKLNTAVMRTVCNPETGECDAPYDNMPMLEEKVVTMLGSMLPLLNRGREEVLSGRSSLANTYRGADLSVMESKLPPLAVFRGDMKKCCENLHVALANYLTPLDNQSANIWEKMQRLKNVCYDAGFPRGEGHPNPTLFANWSPVYLSNKKEEITAEDCEVAFWKGGQVTAEGLNWLLDKRFKTIVDLRNDVVVDKYYQKAIDHAISNGKLELVTMHVEVGTAPSMEQVKQFAGLVSDLSKQPLYLHSQEGVSRTSAMVSRWRQYIGRLLSRSTSNKTNRKDAFEEGSKVTSPPKYDSSKQEVELLSNENGSPLKELGSDVSVAPIGANHANGDSSDMNINGVTKSSDGEVAEASNYGIVKGVNPLKSQIPTVDIFSRKEMTHFFNHKKISPQTFLDFQSERFRNRIIFRGGSTVSVKKFGTNLAAQSSESTNPAKTNGAYSGTMSSSNVINFNEHRKRRNDHSPSLVDSGEIFNFPKSSTPSKVNGQVLSGDGEKMISNGTSKPIDGSADLVEGNMCASTTGVVRIQSRKKAEMFLVRTDGVSCSREKVTESSLAFTHPSTQQQMLMWKSPPKTVLLLKKLGNELMEEAKEVTSFLHHQEKMNILVEPDVHDMFARIPGFGYVQTFYSQDISDLHERVDFVACLGGDGVILHASNLFKGAVPPVVSFNLGSLGFLTSHTFEDYMEDLRSVIHGNNTLGVYITLRMRLHCQVFRKGQAVPGKIFDVLNEVVVDRGSNPYISKIECYEHMRLITKVQGDGVIVATPTGSTAYSTAAGGSMVHPNVPCMLFTPICPHSLSFRPVILPDSAQLELKIPEDARSNAWVSFDGKRRQQLSRGDSVKICMSQHPLPTVNKFDQTGDWFRSLIRCLNWNERLEQRAF